MSKNGVHESRLNPSNQLIRKGLSIRLTKNHRWVQYFCFNEGMVSGPVDLGILCQKLPPKSISCFQEIARFTHQQTPNNLRPKSLGLSTSCFDQQTLEFLPKDLYAKWGHPTAIFGHQALLTLALKYGCFRVPWYPQIIHFNRVFHYKPSILEYTYFWKHPWR